MSSDDGLTVGTGNEEPVFVPWHTIQRVIGFKQDCFTFDRVYLRLEGLATTVEICEEDEGYISALEAIQTRLGIPDEDYWKVVQPPFERNLTVLFERQGKTNINCD